MKLTYLKSATVVLEEGGCRLLMDPWLVDGAYYGAWAHNPPYEWDERLLSSITHIYVSHIHPDHCDAATMQRLPRVPVVIHRFANPALRHMVAGWGFPVIELQHGCETDLGGLNLRVFAADDCDPVVCGRFFGCAMAGNGVESSQIDTLAVVSGQQSVVVNVNDCPWPLAKHMLPKIVRQYRHIDMLLVGYGGAGPYPQCFPGVDQERAAAIKQRRFLEDAARFVAALEPEYVIPFAGQYHLAGRLVPLQSRRGVPSLAAAKGWLEANCASRVVALNSGTIFDVDHGETSAPFVPDDPREIEDYADRVLARRRLDYEDDPEPSQAELADMTIAAVRRMKDKREQLGIRSDIRIKLEPVRMSTAVENPAGYVSIDCDPRLYRRLMRGPAVAHWSHAEIGSHLTFRREPDVFDRSIGLLMGSFYA